MVRPYVSFFHTKDKQLIYIAACHDLERKATTFQFIQEAIEGLKPDIVIIEGVEIGDGVSPKKVTKLIKRRCLSEWNCGENLYAAHLAKQKGISFIGGEPNDSEVFKTLVLQGYVPKDIAFFYFTQQIPQFYRENIVKSQADLISVFSTFIANYITQEKYSFNDYKMWLKNKVNNDVSWNHLIDSNFVEPNENGNYLQKLSNIIGVIRDRHIISVILQNFNVHKRILIVFGASHYPVQRNILEQMLAQPTYFRMPEDLMNYFNEEQRIKNDGFTFKATTYY